MTSLKIQGFKCFVDIEIPVKKLTVLAGGNSVGKSSVIQILLLLRSVFVKGELRTPLNGNFLLNLGNSVQVLSKKGNKENLIAASFDGGSQIFRYEWVANLSTAEVFLQRRKHTFNLTFETHPLAKDNFHYLHAERLGPRSFYEIGVKDRNVGWQGENTIALLSSEIVETPLYNIPKEKIFPKSKNLKLRHQVDLWMDYIVPGVDLNAQRIREINQSYVLYNEHAPYNVGFGISYVLPIIVCGLIARKGEMLIVENPEAHLHPSGQSRIGRFLAKVASAGIHVIVETHSEHVINGIRIASLENEIDNNDVVVNFFSKSEDEFGQPEIDSIHLNKNADLDKWPKGFFDQQQEDLAKIFKLRKNQRK